MTEDLNLRNIEHFSELLKQEPRSRAFAPLAEIYRKKGNLEKALEVALHGVSLNPEFFSGKVAF